ncbi:MAG: hypothetical protein Q9218_002967 [Villophora microphyllina]
MKGHPANPIDLNHIGGLPIIVDTEKRKRSREETGSSSFTREDRVDPRSSEARLSTREHQPIDPGQAWTKPPDTN